MERIGADKDDVLKWYSKPFANWAWATHGVKIDLNKVKRSFVEMGIPPEFYEEFALTKEYANLPDIPLALTSIRTLAKSYELYVITSSPTNAATQQVILSSLKVYGDVFQDVIFRSDKGAVAKELNLRYFIDDQLRFLEQIEAPTIPIAYARPWNRGFEPRGKWTKILEYIQTNSKS